jgi:hypothetical protein
MYQTRAEIPPSVTMIVAIPNRLGRNEEITSKMNRKPKVTIPITPAALLNTWPLNMTRDTEIPAKSYKKKPGKVPGV